MSGIFWIRDSVALRQSPGGPAGRNTEEVHRFTSQELPHGGADHGPTVSRPAFTLITLKTAASCCPLEANVKKIGTRMNGRV